jgi:ATP-dependent RNA helicase DeaD
MPKTFRDLGVREDLVEGLDALGIIHPTPIQERAIPFLMEKGSDLIAQAQTGTGKTAAYGVPLLLKTKPAEKRIQGLVVAPTRELAKQIGKQLFRYTKFCPEKIFIEVLCGGDKMEQQIAAISRPTHLVVATPGRLIELIKKKALTLEHVQHLILDEADEMLSMGFKKELQDIIALSRYRKSTWLFSATFPDGIQQLVKTCMSPDAQRIQVSKGHALNRDIRHQYAVCTREDKPEFIEDYLTEQGDARGMIFCRTKAGAIALGRQLEKAGISAGVIQGDLTQKERDTVMRSFKKERHQFLIATDVAARGIDIEDLSFVIHYQLPDQLEYYTHRSGRTARAGKKGISLVLIEPRERIRIARLEKELDLSFEEVH